MQDLLSKINLEPKQIFAITGFIIVLISIPLSFTLLKKTQTLRSQASTTTGEQQYSLEEILKKSSSKESSQPKEVSKSSLTDLKKLLEATPASTSTTTPTPSPTPEVSLSLGPILTLKIELEGRTEGKQASKVFVGVSSGSTTTKPTYLLTFTLDFPDSGIYRGVSLAGLTPGSTYTAYIKGPSHIDTSSTFVMGPTETLLNNNQAIKVTAGDLNDDNIVNTSDYALAKSSYGATKTSLTWNEKADINADGIVNNLDLSLVSKNLGKTGSSGSWYSSPPKATPSASLQTKSGVGATEPPITPDKGGYWLWIPPVSPQSN